MAGASRVDVQKLGGDVVGTLSGFSLGLVPRVGSETMQRSVLCTGVTADQVQRGDRHVKLRILGVGDGEKLVRRAVNLQGGQTQIAADAVLDVDHGVAHMELSEVLDDLFRVQRARAPGPPLLDLVAEHLAFGDDHQIVRP